MHVRHTPAAIRVLSCSRVNWQGYGREEGDNANDHHQLNEGESVRASRIHSIKGKPRLPDFVALEGKRKAALQALASCSYGGPERHAAALGCTQVRGGNAAVT